MLGYVVLFLGLALVAGGVYLLWRRRGAMLEWGMMRTSNRFPFAIGLICTATGLAGVVVTAGILMIARGM